MQYKFLIYYSIIIELAAIVFLVLLENFLGVLIYIFLHFISSFLISIVLSAVFSRFEMFKNVKKDLLAVLTFFIFMTSVFGIFFSNFMLFFLKNRRFKKKEVIKEVNFNEITVSVPIAKRKFGEGAIHNITSANPNVKLSLLSYIVKQNFSNKGEILKEALSDTNDEVRLMAFSVLSREEDKLNKLIFKLLEDLKTASEKEKEQIYKNLGKLYWEFIYLGITDENLKAFYLNLAKEYFEKSKNDYESKIYLGRIYLKEKKVQKAKELFEEALNFNKALVIPYLAEVYFDEKNFKKVKELINMLDKVNVHPNFYFNYKVWCEGD